MSIHKRAAEQHSLIVCITPLQARIAGSIISQTEEEFDVVYIAYSPSPKHIHYFSELKASQKAFIKWRRPRFSHTLSELFLWQRIPPLLRQREYCNIYFSSIGLIPIAFFIRRNPKALLHTFDDGTFNINPKLYYRWIYREPLSRWITKKICGLPANPDITKATKNHYTIYSPLLNISPRENIIHVRPWISEIPVNATQQGQLVMVLDSWSSCPRTNSRRESFIYSKNHDIYVPHPQLNAGPVLVSSKAKAKLSHLKLEKLIAEDIAQECRSLGYQLKIYAFNSSSLLSLSSIADCINVNINNECAISNEIMEYLNIKSITY